MKEEKKLLLFIRTLRKVLLLFDFLLVVMKKMLTKAFGGLMCQ